MSEMGRSGRTRYFLFGGFLTLVVVVLLSVWFTARERASAQGVDAIVATEAHLSNVLSSVRQAESGQRGYLLTGNPDYLDQYHLALAVLPKEMAALSASLGNGPDAAKFFAVQNLVGKKLAEINKTVALFSAGNKATAMAIVQTNVGKLYMDQLRSLITSIESEQLAQLAARQQMDARNGWLLQLATALSILITLALAWMAIRVNRRNNEELNRIYRLSTDILTVSDSEGRFFRLSPAWEHVTGIPTAAARGKLITAFLHTDDVTKTTDAFSQIGQVESYLNFENRVRRADGSYCLLSWRSVLHPSEGLIYSVARDVTVERAREEQLRQSQKMETVGQLTGGIAHDFNNLLTIITGSLELLERGLTNLDIKSSRRINAAIEGGRRAAALTHRLLAFARQQPLEPKAIEPNRLIADMSEMLHRVLGEPIAVEVVSGAGLWNVSADANQLENAILNLALNARDAMPDGGHLTIETQNTYLDEAYAVTRSEVRPGQYVMIAITDTGIGMSREVCEKAFEPFFTTKPTGQGTGLGLAQVFGFIKQSSGHIAIYSEVGQGTSVKLYLPRLRGRAPIESRAAATAQKKDPLSHGETILLVEDEENVRNFAIEALEEFGYHVLPAEDAAKALEILETNQSISMLFTDVVLTGSMNGRQLADILIQRRPGIKVLFTTGYTRNAIIHHGRLDAGLDFIGKPFTAIGLGEKIRAILDRQESSDAADA